MSTYGSEASGASTLYEEREAENIADYARVPPAGLIVFPGEIISLGGDTVKGFVPKFDTKTKTTKINDKSQKLGHLEVGLSDKERFTIVHYEYPGTNRHSWGFFCNNWPGAAYLHHYLTQPGMSERGVLRIIEWDKDDEKCVFLHNMHFRGWHINILEHHNSQADFNGQAGCSDGLMRYLDYMLELWGLPCGKVANPPDGGVGQ